MHPGELHHFCSFGAVYMALNKHICSFLFFKTVDFSHILGKYLHLNAKEIFTEMSHLGNDIC